ncbi:alpha/beta fold hydrolase [Arthrobacter ginkgonis]|uniref:Alpha/beta fold hydrolase n=1 Tax=Arthrobacter ginkgonis TaxID=1630594 RepID=A0ABP7BRY0_9MICC
MTTFILVPGAGGDAGYWDWLVPHLLRRGHAAIAVDLPAADDTAGLSAYANVIEAAADGHETVTLVAQSMGGFTAPLVAARRPVAEIVLINAMIPKPGETGQDWWANTGHQKAHAAKARADGRDPTGAFDPIAEFFHDVPDNVIQEVLSRGEPRQSNRPFADPWPLTAWPSVPTRIAAGADDRFFPLTFQQHVAQDRLGLPIDVLPGGHLIALSQPERLATYLLDEVAPSSRDGTGP